MGMHYSPNSALVIEITEENIRKLGLGQDGEDFILLMEDEGIETIFDNEDMGEPFFTAFDKKYGFTPSFEYVGDEIDSAEGVEPDTYYLVFSEDDKWIKKPNPKWAALAAVCEPEEASWTSLG